LDGRLCTYERPNKWLGYRLCFVMKLASLILMMSVASLAAARAEDAGLNKLQVAQASPSKSEHQAAGACTPIGLTANGDIVFPWECRETIEKQRGPISVNLPTPPNNPPSHEQSPSPDARGEEAVATVAPVQPKADEKAEDKAEETAVGAASSPDINTASAQVKPRLLAKRMSKLGRTQIGRKAQHAALQSHQGSSGAANAKKTDRVALQPGAAQR
jgi:hypothetical protein